MFSQDYWLLNLGLVIVETLAADEYSTVLWPCHQQPPSQTTHVAGISQLCMEYQATAHSNKIICLTCLYYSLL